VSARGAAKRRRVLVLTHEDLLPPASQEGLPDEEVARAPWKTEHDVVTALTGMGEEVRPVGVVSDLGRIRAAIDEFRPHLAFNLLEEFDGVAVYDQHVVSWLELVRQPYTGCNPRGLTLARDKALSKKILAYHRVPVPRFAVFARGRKVRRPPRLGFPLFVKSTTEEGSLGIAQASLVKDDAHLEERVEFVHRQLGTDAIAEEYIEGRELYVGVLGNTRLVTFPAWELRFTKGNGETPLIATDKAKWDRGYQERHGVETRKAELTADQRARIEALCKRIYRSLDLTGYARMDLRMDAAGRVFVLEANPNPDVGYGEDFAASAEAAGLSYEALLHRILTLGGSYRAPWKG
jgi:D-alanine-D-alanine ligase